MVFGTVIFIVLGALAVGLDLTSQWVQTLGVTPFTYNAISSVAHGLMVLDILLFLGYLLKSSWDLLKEIFK
ncbi:hypothetical protein KW835_13750 [Acidovorax sp. sic0104]|nr:hypothetical protein [Acidovorax sp. sic0104]MBV7542157.1 hypothetical protein [Acidovorax sp. sic0104]